MEKVVSLLKTFCVLFLVVQLVSCKCMRSGQNGDTVSVRSFGAIADDRTDDSDGIQRAVNHAIERGGKLVFEAGNYLVSKPIIVRNGISEIDGNDALIQKTNLGVVFHLLGEKSGASANVRNLHMHNLRIDAMHLEGANGVVGIKGENVSHCKFSELEVVNMAHGHAVLLMTYEHSGSPTNSNVISNNRIVGKAGITKNVSNIRWYPISLSSEIEAPKDGLSIVEHYVKTGVSSSAKDRAFENIITDNRLDGGYYGINIISSDKNQILRNFSTNNVRNVSLQWCANENVISNNRFTESVSSSILVSYGSSRNDITDNHIESSNWIGESLIKVGIGANENRISDNQVISKNKKDPGDYHIYIHIDASHNLVDSNDVSGYCSKAFIAVETAWNSSTKAKYHFAFRKGYDYGGFAHYHMVGNTISNNTIRTKNTDKDIPGIYLGELADQKNGVMLLKDLTVADNHFIGYTDRSEPVFIHSDSEDCSVCKNLKIRQ